MSTNIKQLKLSTGEEVICEVVEDDDFEVIVKNALKMVSKIQDGYKFYTFKNFMIYQDQPHSLQVIRADHIVSYAVPPKDLVLEWETGLQQMYDQGQEEPQMMVSGDSDSNVVPFKPLLH